MTEINQEEYEVLKELDDKWKWIARDENVGAWVYKSKPNKTKLVWQANMFMGLNNNIFQFIQWEDEEPYNIAELIEGYEEHEFVKINQAGRERLNKLFGGESEETEVKNIEWLKEEIHKELEDWHGVEGGIDGDGINEIMLLINQHEESEVKRLERKIKELESYNDELIRDNNQFRNEIDNQEVLSREWISENVEYAYFDMLDGSGRLSSATAIIKPKKLQNLLVPKQERLTIPNYVAKWISEHHEKFDLYPALRRLEEGSTRDYDTYKWYRANTLKFVNAYLTGKYKVAEEREQKYVVEIPNPNKVHEDKNIFLNKKNDKVCLDSAHLFVDDITKYSQFALTEEEIKEDFEWAWEFAKPVEELEE